MQVGVDDALVVVRVETVERPDDALDELVRRLAESDREERSAAEETFERSMKKKLGGLKRRRSS